jgi:hypothetical protein
MSAKQESRWEMPVGNCIVLNMGSSLMDKCPVTRPLEEAMIPSTLSSPRLEQENMFLGQSLLTLNLLWLMKFAQEPIGNFFIQNNSLLVSERIFNFDGRVNAADKSILIFCDQVKKMLLTTTLVATTQLAKRL